MSEVIYALTQRHLVFDGGNLPEILAAAKISWAGAYISASASYPGASATFTLMTDTTENGGYACDFLVGDSWGVAAGGRFAAETLADAGYAVPLAEFVRVNAPQPALAVGYGVVPTLAGGDTDTVTVPMVPSLPDDGYNVSIALAGAAQLLGSLQIIGHDVVSASAVDVSVRNNGILALGGATVLVTALHNG